VADENNFETLRQSYDTVVLNPNIENQFRNEIFEIFKANYNREIKNYLSEYYLLFIPLAVARIQKTILEFLIANPNEFEKEEIIIAIIERDLPCGAIAIKSLQSFFDNINEILEEEDKLLLPIINLTIFENKKWVTDNRIHLNASIKNEEYFKLTTFDIVIDHSILRRSNIYKEMMQYAAGSY
jgi:ATP-dependent DNA helicase RecQ